MQVFPEVKQVLAEFKSKYSLSKLGAQGFCWGGKYTVLLLGAAQPCHFDPAGTSQHCIPRHRRCVTAGTVATLKSTGLLPREAACEAQPSSELVAQGLATLMQAWCATARC